MSNPTEQPDRTSKADRPRKLDAARVKAAIGEAAALARKLGAGAVGLYRKLLDLHTPEEALKAVEEATTANQARNRELSARLEKLFGDITAKRKAWMAAPPARKGVLEAELKTMMATHQAAEREFKVLLENERVLAQVRGRMMEATAYDLAGVTEVQIDRLIDQLDEKAEAAEGRVDAAGALEKAGRRRDRESDRDSFLEQLDKFAEEAPAVGESGAAAAESEPATPEPENPQPEKPD